jgi:hypothetical protein
VRVPIPDISAETSLPRGVAGSVRVSGEIGRTLVVPKLLRKWVGELMRRSMTLDDQPWSESSTDIPIFDPQMRFRCRC